MLQRPQCPDCNVERLDPVTRRRFLQAVGTTAAAASLTGMPTFAGEKPKAEPENLVKKLYETLTPKQKDEVCFEWDYKDDRGLLRTHVSNNWFITDPSLAIGSKFFSSDQQEIIREIFFGMYNPDWHDRILKQLKDDAGGYGKQQTIAIFGTPGSEKFEFVMTGRHLTIRCDGNSTEHVAFGGPIFYGHAAQGFNEKPDHPGNVYWPQALKANALLGMLDGKQRDQALIAQAPGESKVGFRGKSGIPGLPISELSADQKEHAQEILQTLLDPYRKSDQDEVAKCLAANDGLDACHLSFYKSDADGKPDLGNDGVWDIWRLEGPAFVWHFRGSPHVHVWVNVADTADVALNARG